MNYAEVAVNSPLAQPRTFSYSIPAGISLSVGHAVWVPFGPRQVQGIVLALTDRPSVEETKEIARVIGSHPVLSPHHIELARWIAEYYSASYFEAAALMLPPAFERRIITIVQPAPNISEVSISALTTQHRKLLVLLREKGKIEQRALNKLLRSLDIDVDIDKLVRKGLVIRTQEIERARVKPRLVTNVKLAVTAEEAREIIPVLEKRRADRQAKLLHLLVTEDGPITLPEARSKTGISLAVVQALRHKGLVSTEDVRVRRDPLAHRSFAETKPPALTVAQEQAWSAIRAEMTRRSSGELFNIARLPVFLLHGVTGSGKTEIYLKALEYAISLGKRAIVLVPEIALTPQTIARFAERFPNRVAVLHSKLSLGEQFDEWQRIEDGDFDVVIGSRGALFAPQPDLGLIIIDEEHEWTYKQHEQPPRYHAREAAAKLAELTGSVVILGSATPDVTSYYRAQTGEFRLLRLPERIADGESFPMPRVEVVDLRRELKEGNRGILSRSLAESVSKSLSAREQIILFLNRRGTATFVQCRDCGFVLRCRRCDVALTYHAANEDLVCHHCNYKARIPATCPECLSKRIRFLGAGTQKVEEEVARAFPEARLLRWDRDVTKGKHSHEQILDRFLAHEADILIGTQMVAKGLDMPLVTLVGVINADIGLYIPDFRSSERTFQILAQVAGRAGRRKIGGKVIIQSYTPDHYAITAAAKHDYNEFYDREIAFRHEQGNPPFKRLARLVYTHTNAVKCQREAQRMYELLTQLKDAQGLPETGLIGPSPAFAQRIRGRFRWQITIRSPDPMPLLSQLVLPQRWSLDIDPVNML